PTGLTKPNASNLNWSAGETLPNRVTVPIGAGGKVTCANSSGRADLIIDVNGYYTDATAAGASFVTLSPIRIVDSRNGTGGVSGRLTSGQTVSIAVSDTGGVPGMGSGTPPTA